jgi:radical SAM superfamily enzyme YgiQ (UPF0313 family)/glycosyltransferase involved in cell wall biosynthesis
MRILLIAPKFVNYGKHYDFPIGLAYVSASLKKAGFEVFCLNLNHCKDSTENEVARTLKFIQPDILGTGGLSVHYQIIKQIVDIAKNIIPDLKIMLGGGIISSEPILMLKALNGDFGVIGEGEDTVVKLMQTIDKNQNLSNVNGISFKTVKKGKVEILRTQEAHPIVDINDIPWPDFEGFDIKFYLDSQRVTDFYFNTGNNHPRVFEMIASRSCPYDCSFCFHPLGRIYRERSLDNFFQELDYVVNNYNVNTLMILDELFAANNKRLIDFCERIKNYNLKWLVQLRVDSVNEEMLQLMKDSGCASISYGIESMSEKVLVGMNKKIKPSLVENALYMTYKNAINIQGNLIFGDTTETALTVKESLDWWIKNRQYQINLTMIQHYPGTKIYNDAIKKGIITDIVAFIENGCPIINTTEMDDLLYNEMHWWVDFLDKALMLPAKLLNYSKLDIIDPLRGELYDLECICPHCNHKNIFLALPINDVNAIFGRKTFRLACSECNQRFDIPEIIPKPVFNDYVEGLLEQLSSKHFNSNKKILENIIHSYPNYSKAYFLLGKEYFAHRDGLNAFRFITNAILVDPTNPLYHKLLGRILEETGRTDDALIFYNHANVLLDARSPIYPKVSIVVTMYNRESYIEQCINSILTQDYANLEIILIDDCSTDGTVDRVKKYLNDDRVKLYVNKENIGVYKNCEEALKYVTGEWVVFLASDDYFVDNTFISQAVEKTKKFSGIVVVCGSVKLLYEDKNQVYDIGDAVEGIFDGKEVFLQGVHIWDNFFRTSIGAMIMKTSLIKNVNIFASSVPDNDIEIFFRLCLKGKIYKTGKPAMMFRIHKNNMAKYETIDDFKCMSVYNSIVPLILYNIAIKEEDISKEVMDKWLIKNIMLFLLRRYDSKIRKEIFYYLKDTYEYAISERGFSVEEFGIKVLFERIKNIKEYTEVLENRIKKAKNVLKDMELVGNLNDLDIQENISVLIKENEIKDDFFDVFVNPTVKIGINNSDLEQYKQKIDFLNKQLVEKQNALDNIFNSFSWKVLKFYYSLRDRILPFNTKRRKISKHIFKSLITFISYIRNIKNNTIKKIRTN